MKRNVAIDLLRIISILGVVLVHVCGKSLGVGYYYILQMLPTFIVERLSRFAVPIFFIVSGYILTSRYKPGTYVFYKKRTMRLLIPYIFWSIFYMLFLEYFNPLKLLNFGSVGKILNGSASIQLYFIPSLFILYLAFPFIYRLKKFFTKKFLLIYTFIEIFALSFDYFIHPISSYDPLRISILTLYLFIIGMTTYIYEKEITEFVSRYFLLLSIVAVFAFALFAAISALLFINLHNYSYLSSQWQPFLFLYAILIWFLAYTWFSRKKLTAGISYIARLVFFVFFIHVFYLSLIWKLTGSYLFSLTQGNVIHTIWFTPMIFIAVTLLSFATAYILKRIAIFNNLLGIN